MLRLRRDVIIERDILIEDREFDGESNGISLIKFNGRVIVIQRIVLSFLS